jgi:DNA-binding transcriptional LysR family regulator
LVIGLERAFADTRTGAPPTDTKTIPANQPLRFTLPPQLGLDRVAEGLEALEIETASFPLSPARAQIGLLQNSLDLVFGPLPVRPPQLATAPLGTAHWTLVLPKDLALADQTALPLETLIDLPLIFFEREQNPDHYDATRARFERASVPLRVRMDVSEPETALQMVADGLGSYLVESYRAFDLPEGFERKPLTGEAAEIVLGAIWHGENPSPAIPRLLKWLGASDMA